MECRILLMGNTVEMAGGWHLYRTSVSLVEQAQLGFGFIDLETRFSQPIGQCLQISFKILDQGYAGVPSYCEPQTYHTP